MNRFLAAAALVGFAILAAPPCGWGWVPDPEASTVEWRDLVCDSSKVMVCPRGEASYLYVCVRDMLNRPIAEVPVVASFSADCDMSWCQPVEGTTDVNGEVYLAVLCGLDVSGDIACCGVTTTVTCLYAFLHIDTMEWLSPDMNGDLLVNVNDEAILNQDWLTAACRSDFNCDGVVDGLDSSILNSHLGHGCTGTTAVESDDPRPVHRPSLGHNRPNPFSPSTRITFALPEPGFVNLAVYDVSGRCVRTLLEGWEGTRPCEVAWDGDDDAGRPVPSGVYFYQLDASGRVEVRKMVLTR